MPTPTAAERLHAQQQKNRKAAGLPDPSEYKKKLDSMKSENYEEDDGPLSQEQLDEISAQLKASYVSGAKKQIKQSLPFTKKTDEYRDIAKNFIAKRQKGIAKANEEVEQLDENEDKVNARKMYHKHFMLAMKSMASSPQQKRHQAEMEKYRAMMGDSFIDQVAPSKFAKFDRKIKEEVEQLDEMPESSMKTRDVHSHLKKSGWELARSKGGHDVYKHPKAKHSIPVPRHNQLKAPLIRGIMKASKVEESFRIGGMGSRGANVHMYDRNPGPKDGNELENVPFHAKTEKQKKLQNALTDLGKKMKETHPKLRESNDPQEYDYEGDMAKSDLRSIMHHAKELHNMIEDTTNLAEWCQSKITLAEDYLSTVANYMRSEMDEEVEIDEMIVVKTNKPIGTRVADIGPGDKEYNVKTDKAYDDAKKKQPQGAEFAAQRRKERLAKSGRMDEGSNYIAKRNQLFQSIEHKVGDSVTVDSKFFGKQKGKVTKIDKQSTHVQRNGKKYSEKYPHDAVVKEEYEQIDEGRASQRHPLEGHEYHKKSNDALVNIAKDAHAAAEAMKSHNPQAENKYRDQANDSATVRHFRKTSGMPDWYKKKYGHVNEDVEQFDEKENRPGLWANIHAKRKRGESPAKPGDKDYPKNLETVRNADKGSVKESAAEPTEGEMKGKQGYSRKAQIVMNAAKGKKADSPEKYQKDPELSSEIHKT